MLTPQINPFFSGRHPTHVMSVPSIDVNITNIQDLASLERESDIPGTRYTAGVRRNYSYGIEPMQCHVISFYKTQDGRHTCYHAIHDRLIDEKKNDMKKM